MTGRLRMAHSSTGLGRYPLKAEITGSNLVCAINSILSDYIFILSQVCG